MQEDEESVTGKHADAEDHVVADENIQDLDNGEKDFRVAGVLRGKYMITGFICAGCGTSGPAFPGAKDGAIGGVRERVKHGALL
jgi:hypothetical protein